MPNIKSAEKRVEITKKQNLANRSATSEVNSYIKKFKAAIAAGNAAEAEALLKVLFSKLDSAAADSTMHKNKADSKKAEFSKLLDSLKKKA